MKNRFQLPAAIRLNKCAAPLHIRFLWPILAPHHIILAPPLPQKKILAPPASKRISETSRLCAMATSKKMTKPCFRLKVDSGKCLNNLEKWFVKENLKCVNAFAISKYYLICVKGRSSPSVLQSDHEIG